MALEDLCEDMMLEEREGKNIPGREKSQCRGPEMEEKVCSRHGTRDTTAEAWGTRGKRYEMRLERRAQARSQGPASYGKEFGSWM